MLLLTRAPAPPDWQAVLASPDERVLWAILAASGLAALAGLWLRRRHARRSDRDLAPPETFG
ncbi:hypothetical protein ACNOYE_13410 [Nannocystaceae bacterium ST9]